MSDTKYVMRNWPISKYWILSLLCSLFTALNTESWTLASPWIHCVISVQCESRVSYSSELPEQHNESCRIVNETHSESSAALTVCCVCCHQEFISRFWWILKDLLVDGKLEKGECLHTDPLSSVQVTELFMETLKLWSDICIVHYKSINICHALVVVVFQRFVTFIGHFIIWMEPLWESLCMLMVGFLRLMLLLRKGLILCHTHLTLLI